MMNNNNYSGEDEKRRRSSPPLESKPLKYQLPVSLLADNHHNHSLNIANNNNNIHLNNINLLEGNMVMSDEIMKAKIMAHPLFPRLLTTYVNCQKVGAPSEVVARLEQVCGGSCEGSIGISERRDSSEDPALDQFMEAYCEMLAKYEQELTKPFKEAMLFLTRIESQLKALTLNSSSSNTTTTDIISDGGDFAVENESSELKVELLRKYSGYIGGLKQEFMKKKKNGKLPKEARKLLLDWWTRHYKWPYPSEGQKMALAETTGLEVKQINNWFINQRKRHWKPSDDMQFLVMDGHYYMDIYNNNLPDNI